LVFGFVWRSDFGICLVFGAWNLGFVAKRFWDLGFSQGDYRQQAVV
jgi:hypothetical protein